jgi:beta-lactamase class A
VRRTNRARTSLLLILGALLATAASASSGIDQPLARARATVSFSRTSEGMQARYDAGRALEIALYGARRGCAVDLSLARGLVRWAEGYDRLDGRLEGAGRQQAVTAAIRASGCRRTYLAPPRQRLRALPALVAASPPRSSDSALDARLDALGKSFNGYAAIWVHDLVRGTRAGWNVDARFPAASTVKLGVLLAALQRLRHPERSALDYDLRAMVGWSSNLAANLLVERFGVPAAESALRRAGAYRSTFPQGYRVGSARADVQDQPPLVSGRVTTARDLGRILYVIHACARGQAAGLRATGLDRGRCAYGLRLLLGSELQGNNVGLVRPYVSRRTPVAQKNGWLHDARHTAAIVYGARGPKIVVILTYATDLKLATAKELGRRVVAAPGG